MNKIFNNEMFSRNKGLITDNQQNILKNSAVAVFGLGGLGGVICEILVRSGIYNLKLIDKDVFDKSNLNRQIYANINSIGKLKIEITKKQLLKINPDLIIEAYTEINEQNILTILNKVNVAVLALDETLPCIIISRHTKLENIPLVEGWALPYGNVRVFTNETPSLEEVYHLPTKGKDIFELTDEEMKDLNYKMIIELKKIKGVNKYYDENVNERIKEQVIPSFAPMVWLTACIMSFEVLKILLGTGNIAFAPDIKLYNPFEFRMEK